MNRNLNVFWGLVLCVGMVGGLIVLSHRSVSESDYGNPNEFYNSSSARTYSHVSSSAAVADGVGVPMRSTSSMRRGGSFVYAPAYTTPNGPIASSPNGPIASSPISYTSSSATAKSFGSGIGAGVSMSGGAVRSASGNVSMSAGGGISSPIALPFREGTGVGFNSPITSSPVAITDPAAAAASYEGIGNTTGGPRGMRGRQKVGPGNGPTVEDSWLIWLSQHPSFGSSVEGGWYFDQYQLKAAWEEYCASWNVTMGPCPTWEQWYDWFTGGTGTHTWGSGENTFTAHFVPVGEIVPLLVIALLYALGMFFRSKKVSKIQISRD